MRKIPMNNDQLRQLRAEMGDDWKSEISWLSSDATSVSKFGDDYVDDKGKIHMNPGPFFSLTGKELPRPEPWYTNSPYNRYSRNPAMYDFFKPEDQGIFFDRKNPGQMMYSRRAASQTQEQQKLRQELYYPHQKRAEETFNRRSGLLALMTADSDFGYSGSKTGTVSSTPVDVRIHEGSRSIPDAVYRSKKDIEEDQALRRRVTPSRSYTTAAAGPKISSKVHAPPTSSARTRPRVTVPKKK